MANETRYNGWTNYETWCVNLWIGNDQGSQDWADEMAQYQWDHCEADETNTRAENATYALADVLKEEYTGEGNPLADKASVYSDLLNAALREVNWQEIAGHYIDTCAENAAAE